jgi:hypothetical protein
MGGTVLPEVQKLLKPVLLFEDEKTQDGKDCEYLVYLETVES